MSGARASTGAQQNRLEQAARGFTSAAIQQATAGSRTGDTDFASEVAGLAMTLVQQFASNALLSQANATAGATLRLLTGRLA